MSSWTKENYESEISYSMYKRWCSKHTKSDLYIIERGYTDKELEKIIDKEVESRKKNLIARVEKKAGKIIDANGLYIGANGEINGYIKGDKTTVYVETIFAGGYNIQCLHYRVLIKVISS